MQLRLERRFKGEEYTIGKLFIDGLYVCETIEDKVRDFNADGDLNDPGEGKVPTKTAIPFGRYRVDLTVSPKFKRALPILIGVKHFSGIRIHKGRTAAHSHGCILPGENKLKGQVLKSEKYEMLIVERMLTALKNREELWINIV